MKRPARWLPALALAACALAWWWNRPPPEPSYNGVPLSQWMRENYTTRDADYGLVGQELRSARPSALGWLIYTAERDHSKANDREPLGRILAKIQRRMDVSKWPLGYDEQSVAMQILGGMGTMARPAISTLQRALHSDSFDHVYSAAGALNKIGPDSWPVVEQELTHGSNLTRCGLLHTMFLRLQATWGVVSEHDVSKAFNLLAAALQDPEPNIRRNAASSLYSAMNSSIPGPLVDQTAALLWPLPDESNREVADAKKTVLSYYRDTQTEAIPRLTALLADPDEAKRNFARAMLEQLGTTLPKGETALAPPAEAAQLHGPAGGD